MTAILLSCSRSSLKKDGKTALMMAAYESEWEVCLKLAELGAELDKEDQVSEICCRCINA